MGTSYLSSAIRQFEYYKMIGEKAIAQVPDEALFWQYNNESNSIAVVVNHMVGNMLSRFTDFSTKDGEKPWRNRDSEFKKKFSTREELMSYWNEGWNRLLKTLGTLSEDQLEDIVYIRNEGHTVIEAINRQLAHYPYHIGQIIYIAKMVVDEKWESLSIPRDKSEDYNEKKFGQEKARRHFTDDL